MRLLYSMLLIATVSLFSQIVSAQMYYGISYIGMDYLQDDVTIATLDDRDPLLTGIAFVNSTPGAAQRGFIILQEGDVSLATLGDSSRPNRIRDIDVNLEAFNLKFGYSFNRFISLELRAGAGTSPAELKSYSEELRDNRTLTLTSNSVGVNFANTLNVLFEDEVAAGNPNGFRMFDTALHNGGRDSINITETRPKDSLIRTELFLGSYVRFGGDFRSWYVSPYVLIGQTHIKFVVNDDQGTGGGTVDTLSYGGGFNIKLNEKMYFNVEYLDLVDKENLEVKSWSGGIEFRF